MWQGGEIKKKTALCSNVQKCMNISLNQCDIIVCC